MTAWISDDIKIEEDAIVTINTLGLLGEKYLEILPGTTGGPVIKPDGVLTGKDPVSMEKITENLASLSESVKTIVDKIKSGEGTIGKLLNEDAIYNNLKATTSNLEAFTADIKKHPWKLLNRPRSGE